jgi:CRP-like cAMP-binding protein
LHEPGKNRLLELLPKPEQTRLVSAMQRIDARHGDPVFQRRKPIPFVDFPLSGMISLVAVMRDGAVAEVGMIGNEGVAGLPLVLGVTEDPNDAFYQMPGEALRMPAGMFRNELARRGPFEAIVRRYAQAFFAQVAQSTACNRLHAVDQRLCRWILMSHDRAGQSTIALTQEFLGQMLGVRRASVSVVAGALQKRGLIRYSRGVIEVLDRAALEEAACECYGVVRDEMERLLV